MECDRYFPSVTFVVLTVDQFVGHGGSLLERQRQDSHVYRKTGTLPLILFSCASQPLWKACCFLDAVSKGISSNFVEAFQ